MSKEKFMCMFCGRDLEDSETCPHRDDWGVFNLIGLMPEEEKKAERKRLKELKDKSKHPECWEPMRNEA